MWTGLQMNALIWAFGIGGMVSNFLIYQQNGRKKLLAVKLCSDVLWAIHYGLLAAWSGAAICVIGIIRETVFLNQEKKWAKGKQWLLVFLLLSILSAVVTWKNIGSMLPAIGSALAVFSFWRGNPKLTRILAFPISICYLIYNILCRSYVGIVNEVIIQISSAIGLVREKIEDSKRQGLLQ